jgi:ubiquinol-cytochrome c reductase cytochrome b subunit
MSVFRRLWQWFDDRTGTSDAIKPLLAHRVPPKLGWWYVFGTATLTAFAIQVVTGIFLASVYVASPEGAFESLKYITLTAPFGHLLRGIHYFGASAMVLFAVVHMTRVFLTAAYKYPREMSWISGTLLLVLTLGMGFTGQLLRWDQNAIWSVVVGAEQAGRLPIIGNWVGHFILGGQTMGADTLGHMFSIHVFIFPILIVAVVGLHLYLVIRNGISELPKSGQPVVPETYRETYHNMLEATGEPFWPRAAWRDVAFGTLVLGGIVFLAYVVGPPALGKPPNPTLIQAEPRPDWYFLWYFAILALSPHKLESYIMILGPLLTGVILIGLPLVFRKGERAMRHRPWAPIFVLCVFTALIALTLAGIKAPWSPRFDAKPLTAKIVGASSGPVWDGAQIFNKKGCLYCHQIAGHGGFRGPDLTYVAAHMTREQLIIQVMNGGYNMPAFGGILSSNDLHSLIQFLETRTPKGEKPVEYTPGASLKDK